MKTSVSRGNSRMPRRFFRRQAKSPTGLNCLPPRPRPRHSNEMFVQVLQGLRHEGEALHAVKFVLAFEDFVLHTIGCAESLIHFVQLLEALVASGDWENGIIGPGLRK